MKSLVSDIVQINFTKIDDIYSIEKSLSDKFGQILRWAIVDIHDSTLKICLAYEKEV